MTELKVSEEKQIEKKRSPWFFIPTQYFVSGIPFVIVNQLSTAMFKSLGASTVFIGFTSLLYIPWAIKLFWGPLIDSYGTKRSWSVFLQLAMAICFAALALTVQLPEVIVIALVIFTIIAFLSASYDIATDGFYLNALDKGDQAFFTGIRSTFYRLATIVAGGLLVKFAGDIGEKTGIISAGWSAAFGMAAILFFVLFFYHKFILPKPITDVGVKSDSNKIPYAKIFKTYFQQENIAIILFFILFYRFGEGLMLKMAIPFFMDKPAVGGLGLTVSDVGVMYGTFGILALTIGGILGGIWAKKVGLKKLLLPMALMVNLPNSLYAYMAFTQPLTMTTIDISFIPAIFGSTASWVFTVNAAAQLIIVTEQFFYGIGFTGFMVYLLYISKGEYKTSHFAISTGFMAVGMMVPGILSGIIQNAVGYAWLFLIAFLFIIPSVLPVFFLPIPDKDKEE